MSHAAIVDEIWKILHDVSVGLAEVKEQSRLTAEQMKRTDERIERTSREVSTLTNKWGQFVENMVAPACATLFAARGIPVHSVSQRARCHRDGVVMEIDVLVVNGDHVVLVEVKSAMTMADVDRHLERLAKFKLGFPEYANRQVHGAIAGVDQPKHVIDYAVENGMFVLVQQGETMTILNSEAFTPTSW